MSEQADSLASSAPCPRCGWEHRTVDAARGLHVINRRCLRGRCRGWFWAIFRGAELVDTVPAHGYDEDALRESLRASPLTSEEMEEIVGLAMRRANGGEAA